MITSAARERRSEFALKAVEHANSSVQEDPWLWEAD